MIVVEFDLYIDTVNSVSIRVPSIVTEFVVNVEANQQARGNTDGECENIDCRIEPAFYQLPIGNGDVIADHKSGDSFFLRFVETFVAAEGFYDFVVSFD